MSGVGPDMRSARICWYFSSVDDGDFARPSAESLRQLDPVLAGTEMGAHDQGSVAFDWSWSHQIHGSTAHVVTNGGQTDDGDALVTAVSGVALSIRTADCCPVLIWSDAGTIAAAHAGWRGLVGGVLESTIAAIRQTGDDTALHGQIGPSIGSCCYEFGEADLALAVDRLGPVVRGSTTGNKPSLDVVAGVRSVLAAKSVSLPDGDPPCTRCTTGYFSHRRGDTGRQVAAIALLDGRE